MSVLADRAAVGWIDVTWDAGGSNSYRMGAEGKFDLMLAPSHDSDQLNKDPVVFESSDAKAKVLPTDKTKV